MEDLVGALSGGMHVSQDGYDIKALHEYLSQTISIPTLPMAGTPYYAPPSSRSTSTTRNPNAQWDNYASGQQHHFIPEKAPMVSPIGPGPSSQAFNQPYPSPVTNSAFFHSAEELSTPSAAAARTPSMQRSSSYGFPTTKEFSGLTTSHSASAPTFDSWNTDSSSYDSDNDMRDDMIPPDSPITGFESDAFAPLWQRQDATTTDQWGNPAQTYSKPNPWAAFNGQSSTFGRRRDTSVDIAVSKDLSQSTVVPVRDDVVVEESMDMEMEAQDDEMVDASLTMFESEQETTKKRGLGLNFGSWERGRRKRQ